MLSMESFFFWRMDRDSVFSLKKRKSKHALDFDLDQDASGVDRKDKLTDEKSPCKIRI